MGLVLCVCVLAMSGLVSCSNGDSNKTENAPPAPPVKKLIDSVGVAVTPISGIKLGWNFRVDNKSVAPIKLIWDESAFVDSSGRSLGRLIPTVTRRMDIGKPHPSSTIPAGAFIDESAIPDQMIEWVDGYSIGQHSGSGKVTLTLDFGDRKETWQSEEMAYGVVDPPSAFYCFDVGKGGVSVLSSCHRSRTQCEQLARLMAKRPASEVGQCLPAERAFCASMKASNTRVAGEVCSSNLRGCLLAAGDGELAPQNTCAEVSPAKQP